jgi:hypothetical protein
LRALLSFHDRTPSALATRLSSSSSNKEYEVINIEV